VSDSGPQAGWKSRVLDYIALGFILLSTEELWRRPSAWYSWLGALAAGVICAWFGDVGPTIKTKVVRWWRAPKDLAIALAENSAMKLHISQTLQEIAELRKEFGLPKELAALPAPQQNRLVKPQHNVRCVGFKYIDSDPFKIAALRFQNVPTGKPIGKFEWPRLRVIFYQNSTGQEVADMCPIEWWDEKDGVTDISAEGRDADVASFFEGKWTASETYSDENTLQIRLHSEELPFGEIRITAILTGGFGNLQIPHITGVLILGEDGTASFVRD
jgi:hypothetical protein